MDIKLSHSPSLISTSTKLDQLHQNENFDELQGIQITPTKSIATEYSLATETPTDPSKSEGKDGQNYKPDTIMQKRTQLDSEFQHTHSVDMKQLRDSPIEDAQNCTRMEKQWEEELKETSCDHTQPTDDNHCCCKLLVNDSPEGNALPSTPMRVNGTIMHVVDQAERMQELGDPPIASSSNLPVFNVLCSGQTSGYEQIHGYEKIQHYEQIQRYEKIQHCDVNVESDEVQVEIVTNPAPTLALTKQIAGSSEDIQSQYHLLVADCCHECKGYNLENSLGMENITENNLVSALDSASVQIESPIPVNNGENDSEVLQENDTGSCFGGSNSNLGGYEQICGYERIEHCDLNFAHVLSPAIAEDVV